VLACKGTKEDGTVALVAAMESAPDEPVRVAKAPARKAAKSGAKKAPEKGSEEEWLSSWEGEVDGRLVHAARGILTSTATKLQKMSPQVRQREGAAALGAGVKELNDLDAKNDHFVKTIEAEDLHEALGLVAERFGIADWEKIVDKARDW
jgi:hypothetical protein